MKKQISKILITSLMLQTLSMSTFANSEQDAMVLYGLATAFNGGVAFYTKMSLDNIKFVESGINEIKYKQYIDMNHGYFKELPYLNPDDFLTKQNVQRFDNVFIVPDELYVAWDKAYQIKNDYSFNSEKAKKISNILKELEVDSEITFEYKLDSNSSQVETFKGDLKKAIDFLENDLTNRPVVSINLIVERENVVKDFYASRVKLFNANKRIREVNEIIKASREKTIKLNEMHEYTNLHRAYDKAKMKDSIKYAKYRIGAAVATGVAVFAVAGLLVSIREDGTEQILPCQDSLCEKMNQLQVKAYSESIQVEKN